MRHGVSQSTKGPMSYFSAQANSRGYAAETETICLKWAPRTTVDKQPLEITEDT